LRFYSFWGWRRIFERAVGPQGVVVASPLFNQCPGLVQGVKYLSVKQLVMKLADKRFDITLLPKAARLNEADSGIDRVQINIDAHRRDWSFSVIRFLRALFSRLNSAVYDFIYAVTRYSKLAWIFEV
jgi:hypothetical protein